MPWCPKCKNEYVEGMKVCADCGCELVESLDGLEKTAMTFGTEEEIRPIFEFLRANHFKTASMEETEEPGIFELYIGEAEQAKAARAVQIFCQKASEEVKRDAAFEELYRGSAAREFKEAVPQKVNSGIYQKSSEKADEFRSSAYVLIIVGVLGFIGLVFLDFGLLPIKLAAFNRYLINGVMGAMFLLFLVMGVLSMRSSRQLSVKAKKEDELTKEILNWCQENLTAEKMDEILFTTEAERNMNEEAKYFKRAEWMQMRITEQFVNLDEAYVEQLVDDYYHKVFS